MHGVTGTVTWLQKITQIVRILPPLLVWIGTRRGHAKPQCFDDSRDSKNDSIWGARREMQSPRSAMHRASMVATDGQRNWPTMRKTLGEPGFLIGEDRNRTFGCFASVFERVRKAMKRLVWNACGVVFFSKMVIPISSAKTPGAGPIVEPSNLIHLRHS
jgi:hypothetical protein